MDLSKEWYRSEFVNQEMLEQHRVIETEYTFYDAIEMEISNMYRITVKIRPSPTRMEWENCPTTNFRISAITLLSRPP